MTSFQCSLSLEFNLFNCGPRAGCFIGLVICCCNSLKHKITASTKLFVFFCVFSASKQLFSNPHFFDEMWFSRCQHCGHKFLEDSFQKLDNILLELQYSLFQSYLNDSDSFIRSDFLSALSVTVNQCYILSEKIKEKNGYKGTIGLFVAKTELLYFKKKEKSIPKTRDGFSSISTAIKRGEWISMAFTLGMIC